MTHYALTRFLPAKSPETDELVIEQRVMPYLIGRWVDEYLGSNAKAGLVETTVDRFSYLFDVAEERLVAAWGISRGAHSAPRPKARMAGYPGAGAGFHRGHAIAHSLGGGADINLVAQRASVNIGPFRMLEIRAVESPGALYFTHWLYRAGGRVPFAVDQGLIRPGHAPEIRVHPN